MTVILAPAFSGIAYPLDHPRIGWRSIAGTAITSGAQAGYPAANALDVRTAIAWCPDAVPAWVGVNAGATVQVNYCGIAGHDLGTRGAVIAIDRWNGAAWVTVIADRPIASNDAIMILMLPFETTQVRLRIVSATGIPRIGHVRFGRVTEVPQKTDFAGTTPISERRTYEYDTLRANNGAFLGRSIVSTGLQFTLSVQYVSEDWRRTEWAEFRDYANKGNATFFIADRPQSYPEDVAYAWSNEAMSASRGMANKRISGEFTLQCEAL
jgi:hypothetical protein